MAAAILFADDSDLPAHEARMSSAAPADEGLRRRRPSTDTAVPATSADIEGGGDGGTNNSFWSRLQNFGAQLLSAPASTLFNTISGLFGHVFALFWSVLA